MDGVLQLPVGFVDYPLKSANIDIWNRVFLWRDDIPYHMICPPDIAGGMVDNSPVDVVSWTEQGVEGVDMLVVWKRCLMMLMRI